MEYHFNYKLNLPDDRLCPPVQNRLNYIHWLHNLVDFTAGQFPFDQDSEHEVIGLDVGTGCCSIYPLIGCATRKNWKFLATDTDEKNIQTAKQNVALNNLESRIHIQQTSLNDPLLPLDKLGRENIDFTMCNPPFYSSHDEMEKSAAGKEHAPSAVCTGAETEMITPGGEVAFVTRMIDESRALANQVKWFTSMLGKLSSVITLAQKLQDSGVGNYAVTEFVQGRTKRWAIAWSWQDRRPAMNVARAIPGFPKHLMPFPSDYIITLDAGTSVDAVDGALDQHLDDLPMYWRKDESHATRLGFTEGNTWSRQARRKIQLAQAAGNPPSKPTKIPEHVAMGVRIQRYWLENERAVQLTISWIQGMDQTIFESFCGMVKRIIGTKFQA
ncbi:hypothetical protein N7492_002462 [Penicillium capsulatum]|uniref:U6 small nuclear RNA (adenine-(43)-N(6))-methyltransferase n=1 Tax=Penicillium capsulatum TaxID=69766 RepID=A0A9W9IK40_9EURO|nr:hypothetical protein N7492_002462 [Penicillium capsulatum]